MDKYVAYSFLVPLAGMVIYATKGFWVGREHRKKKINNLGKKVAEYYEDLVVGTPFKDSMKEFIRLKVSLFLIVVVLLLAIKSTNNGIVWRKINSFNPSINSTQFSQTGEDIELKEMYLEGEIGLFKEMRDKSIRMEDREELLMEMNYYINMWVTSPLSKVELIEKTISRIEQYKRIKFRANHILIGICAGAIGFILPDIWCILIVYVDKHKVESEVFFCKQRYVLLAGNNLSHMDILKIIRRDSKYIGVYIGEAIDITLMNGMDIEDYKKLCRGIKNLQVKLFMEELLLIGEDKEAIKDMFVKHRKVDEMRRDREEKKKIEAISLFGRISSIIIMTLLLLYGMKPFVEYISKFDI